MAARKSYVYCSEHCGERATHKYYDHSCKSINVIINDKSPFHRSPDLKKKKFQVLIENYWLFILYAVERESREDVYMKGKQSKCMPFKAISFR